jgi:DNA polymerase-3 subunit epsilon
MTLIYFDTETTGIRPDKDRIVEMAAYDPLRERTFVELIKADLPIPDEATAIHGITNEMVANARSFKEVGQAFTDFCGPDAVLVAHNGIAFDQPFLAQEFARHGMQPPQWPLIDTLKWARKYRPDLPKHALQHLREVYGIPPNQAHRALDDVITLYKIFAQMIDDLSVPTILELLSDSTPGVKRMPFGKHRGKALSAVPKDYVRWLASSGALDKAENSGLKEEFLALAYL